METESHVQTEQKYAKINPEANSPVSGKGARNILKNKLAVRMLVIRLFQGPDITCINKDGSVEDTIRRADKAMYDYKAESKARDEKKEEQ